MFRSAVRHLRARAATGVAGGPDGPDAGAALLTVVLLMFVVMALATLVLGAVVSQVAPTQATQQSTQVVFAAETGLQTTLSQLRTSTGATGAGQLSALPCSVSDSVPSSTGALSFTARVTYFTQDPSGKDATWLKANRIPPCTGEATGPTAAGAAMTTQPAFALLSVTGTDSSSGARVHSRSLLAQYAFRVSNRNIPGGVLFTATNQACLQATSDTAGSTITYAPGTGCSADTPTQRWVYDTGYHLALASTITTTTTTAQDGTQTTTTSALCITQPDLSATDRTVTLQACTLDSRNAMQLWSYEGGGHFRGQNADNTDYGSNCLYAGQTSWTAGDTLKAGGSSTCSSSTQDWGSFSPEARVGAGAASMQTSQIVNYKEFGRCADVTNQKSGYSYMILYPCKQDPSGGTKLNWNHRWYYGAESGTANEPSGADGMSTRIRIRVNNDPNQTLCLTTPSAAATPAYVVFRTCDNTASQQYTRFYTTGSYASSYTFVTSDGRCLGIGPQQQPGGGGVYWSTIIADTCSGGPDQKWNAPPTALDSSVTRQLETSTGS